MANEPVGIIRKYELCPKMLNQTDRDTVEIHREFLGLMLVKNTVYNCEHSRTTNFQYHYRKRINNVIREKNFEQTLTMKQANMVHHDCEEFVSPIYVTNANL